jgi:hypothetical protein
MGNRKGANLRVAAIAATLPKGKTADIAAKRAGFKSADGFWAVSGLEGVWRSGEGQRRSQRAGNGARRGL